MRASRLFLVVCIGAATGCSTQVNPVQTAATSERVFKRNYQLGKSQSVFVGEAVVNFKDYVAVTRRGKTMRPSVGFRAKQVAGWYSGSADQDYRVTGSISIGGVNYAVVPFVDIGKPSETAVLVGPDGKPYHKLFAVSAQTPVILGSATFDPPTVTFQPGGDEITVDKKAGFRNFELVYGGTDGKSFNLSYREYSPDDLIRPAFTQTLTYERGSTNVRFRDVQIAVQEATSEKITYTVQADGGTPGPATK